MIWHTVIWAIWRDKNNRIFNDKAVEVDEIVDEIKRSLVVE